MAYSQSNTDPVSVNGMFLKFYLDVMTGMTTTFNEENVGGFMLYAQFLKACVPSVERRNKVDLEMIEVQKKIENGEFGELGARHKEFLKGFCVVSASVNFLNDAFHITMNDSTALADTTDEELLKELEKYMLYKKVRTELKHDKKRLKEIEGKLFRNEITTMDEMAEELIKPEELVPQDDNESQGDIEDDNVDE